MSNVKSQMSKGGGEMSEVFLVILGQQLNSERFNINFND